MIDRFGREKINYIVALKDKNSFLIVKEIFSKGLDPNGIVNMSELHDLDVEKKLDVYTKEELQAIEGKNLLYVTAHQILNEDQKEIIQLLLLLGAVDSGNAAAKLLKKLRKDFYQELKKKDWDTLPMQMLFGKEWRVKVNQMITRIYDILSLLWMQWDYDNEWKEENPLRTNVMYLFKNYIPLAMNFFTYKHYENIAEARNIVSHLEKNPELSEDKIKQLLLNIGDPKNASGEFNRRLNFCYNKLSLQQKRLNMTTGLISVNVELKASSRI